MVNSTLRRARAMIAKWCWRIAALAVPIVLFVEFKVVVTPTERKLHQRNIRRGSAGAAGGDSAGGGSAAAGVMGLIFMMAAAAVVVVVEVVVVVRHAFNMERRG